MIDGEDGKSRPKATCSRCRCPRRESWRLRTSMPVRRTNAPRGWRCGYGPTSRAHGRSTTASAGKLRRLTLGTASDDPSGLTLDRARSKALEHRVTLNNGHDPAAEKKRTEAEDARKDLRVSAVVDDWLKVRKEDMKPRSHVEWTRHLKQHWKPLHKLMLGAVTRQDIAAQMRTIAKDSGPVSANRARGALSAMFAWAIGEGLCEANPVIGTNKAAEEKPRERLLDDPNSLRCGRVPPTTTTAGSSSC